MRWARATKAATAWSFNSAKIRRHALNFIHHADGLPRHDRAVFHVAIDHRAPQRAGPEMFDGELRGGLVEFARLEFLHHIRLMGQKPLGPLIH